MDDIEADDEADDVSTSGMAREEDDFDTSMPGAEDSEVSVVAVISYLEELLS